MGFYNIQKSTDAQYYWTLHGGNGENILTSERYTTKAAARTGIESCRLNSPFDNRYQRLSSTRGLPYFTLHAANGQALGVSEEYNTYQARDTGIASCKVNGPTSVVYDHTGE